MMAEISTRCEERGDAVFVAAVTRKAVCLVEDSLDVRQAIGAQLEAKELLVFRNVLTVPYPTAHDAGPDRRLLQHPPRGHIGDADPVPVSDGPAHCQQFLEERP